MINNLVVDVQYALDISDDEEHPPSSQLLTQWAQDAYKSVAKHPGEVTIRIVDEAEISELNQRYRNKTGSTNVLSFPVELPAELDLPLLGDVVICHSVVMTQAEQQGKTSDAHYAHMVTHGVLHLCGYDHQDDETATVMESLEALILARNNISNPYN